jgi:hypothetical protein
MFAVPEYVAVMVCDPLASAVVVTDAFPLPLMVTVPRFVAPAMNVTVPANDVAVGETTVAVNFTDCPKVDGFRDEATVVVVVALLIVCVTVADWLLKFAVSPGYFATSDNVPTGSLVVARVATPLLLRMAEPTDFAPFKNTTLPVGVTELLVETCARKVTVWP